ncbi:phosphatase PAP2 family protein [Fibrisoma montanum]|uniref:Phosphatase PAP2 family protein n=1 Tax=Fibrisoma montanum TaxID=2305895 RepID=A0A418MKA5_9BACT|nr:vanadium-dependent haloperoxidase [Fibrisoma montanum]RIV27761.1 phosphatase PAP2 family protein [Fibrisoma montanum]
MKHNSKFTLKRATLTLVGLSLLSLQACHPNLSEEPVSPKTKTADQFSSEVAVKWADMSLYLVRNSAGFTPPVAARALGYSGLTMYEAIVNGTTDHQSLAGQLQGLSSLPKANISQPYNWALSANAAEAVVLKTMFANTSAANKAKIDSLENQLLLQYKESDQAVNERSIAYGRSVAEAIVEWSKSDGGHEGYNRNFPSDYKNPVFAGSWQPTENGQQIPLQPYWGKNRTFLSANSTIDLPAPLQVSTEPASSYYKQYAEVYTKNKSLTQEEKEISVWWADDPSETFTPPGHSYNLAKIVVNTSKANLTTAAETFARVGITVADAFILCWKCKYTFNNERPFTFVRRTIDPNWVPFWPAPPFPGYTSGHATQSAATAIVLGSLYGDKFTFTDDTHVGRIRDTKRNVDFKARSFTSFWATAEESALSRFLGGIHTRQDNEIGLLEGRKLGENINALRWKKAI